MARAAIWLFDPNSPWMAILKTFDLTDLFVPAPLPNSCRLATSFQYHATYHMAAGGLTTGGGGTPPGTQFEGEAKRMLWTITIILFVLWLVGMVSSYTLGGWIHLLLVLAVIVLIFNLLSGRRVV